MSFDLFAGKTLAIVGESGCGKTMTALSILRILASPPALPLEGEVWFQERNLVTLSESALRSIRGSEIAMIFQDPMSALNPVYTIGEQLMEVARLHLKMDELAVFDRAVLALEEVGIGEANTRMDAYPHQLSGGMKQRVMIAMAMLCEPKVLIADEPTTALDVTIQKQVLDLMRDLQRRKGTAILLITHDMGVVAEMADEVLVMYATRAVEKGDVFDLFDRMAHPYTQGLFASLPHLAKRGSPLPTIAGRVPPVTELPSGCPFHPRCPFVMECCKKGKVERFYLEEKHWVDCWLYERSNAKS